MQLYSICVRVWTFKPLQPDGRMSKIHTTPDVKGEVTPLTQLVGKSPPAFLVRDQIKHNRNQKKIKYGDKNNHNIWIKKNITSQNAVNSIKMVDLPMVYVSLLGAYPHFPIMFPSSIMFPCCHVSLVY